MARKPQKKGSASKASIKAAADRAEKRARGEPIDEPKVPITPEIKSADESDDTFVKLGDATPKVDPPKLGRPSSYDPSYDERAAELCAGGATDYELAEEFDVNVRTINRWKVAHPSFRHALKDAKRVADDRVKRSLYHKALGVEYEEMQAIKLKRITYADGKRVTEEEYVELVPVKKMMPPDTTAAIFWMKNRDHENWRDVQKVEHGSPGDFDGMSNDELEAYIEAEAKALSETKVAVKRSKTTH